MTHTEILARGTYHYYHHTTGHGGHLSGGAVAVIVIVALLALAVYGFIKYSSDSADR